MRTPKRRTIALSLLVATPVACHFALMGTELQREASIQFSKLDLLVQASVILFAAIGAMAIIGNRFAMKMLALSYAMLFTLICGELILGLARPAIDPTFPFQPMRRVATAGDQMPGVTGEIVFTINQMGVRGPESDPRDADYAILCVGGSTTECAFVTDKLSWPWRIHDQLNEQLDETVLVGNAGKSGHMAMHHRYLMEHYRYAKDYDCIIVLAGINDLGTSLAKRYEHIRGNIEHFTFLTTLNPAAAFYYHKLRTVELLRSLGSKPLSHDTVLQDAQGNWHKNVRLERQAKLRTNPHSALPPDYELMLTRWRSDLESIVTLCNERNQRLIFLTQPTMWRPDLPQDLQDLCWQGAHNDVYTVDVLARMIDRYNEIMLAVANKNNVESIDLASKLPKDGTVYYDDCHFTIEGCRQVAEVVTNYLTSSTQMEKIKR